MLRKSIIPIIMLVLIAANLLIFWDNIDIMNNFNLNQLKENKLILQNYISNNPVFSSFAFVLFYSVVVAFSIPLAVLLSIGGGYLFGILWNTIMLNIGSVIGALITLYISKYLIRDWVLKRFENKVKYVNSHLQRNQISYLLTIRVIPIFPFSLVNLFIGVTDVPLCKFIWTTSLGSIPSTLIYSIAGRNLADINHTKEILTPNIFLSLCLLGLFPLLSVIIKSIKRINSRLS